MPAAARVVGDLSVGAIFASRHAAAQRCRTTALDGRHDIQLAEAHVAGIGTTPGGPVVTEDIDAVDASRHRQRDVPIVV